MKLVLKTIVSAALMASLIQSLSPIAALAASIGSSGNFKKVEQITKGQAQIVKEGNQTYLELSKDFSTSSDGPDLKVILYSADRIPLNIKGKQQRHKLGALKKYRGGQRYEIPSDLNLEKFQSVGIWCEKFDATFAYASLR
jgi:Electron transfer DM13